LTDIPRQSSVLYVFAFVYEHRSLHSYHKSPQMHSKACHCDVFVVTCKLQIRFHDFSYIHHRHHTANATVSDRCPRPMLSKTNTPSPWRRQRGYRRKQRTLRTTVYGSGIKRFALDISRKDRSSKRKGRSLSTILLK